MDKLFIEAQKVLKNSYSPYSNFSVAAALLLKDGNIITGVNVENASFGLTNCAERTAIFSAYTKGYRKDDIVALLVTTPKKEFVSPCGACRQVIKELCNENTKIIIANCLGEEKVLKIADLLPYSFSEEDL